MTSSIPSTARLWGEHVHHGLWRSGRESPTQAVEALSDLVAAQLGLKPGDALVDIGCGYGATARRFAGRGATVTGFTLSAEQVAHAPVAAGVTLICRDWLANDLGAASVDGAYAIESTEHIADKAAFFREAARVLKPGGRLVVCAWLADEHPKPWEVRHLLEPICFEGRLAAMGSASDYRMLGEAAGLTLTGYEDISRQVAKTWSICLARFIGALFTNSAIRTQARAARNRLFALSVPRLILGYRTGALRYGVFTFERPI